MDTGLDTGLGNGMCDEPGNAPATAPGQGAGPAMLRDRRAARRLARQAAAKAASTRAPGRGGGAPGAGPKLAPGPEPVAPAAIAAPSSGLGRAEVVAAYRWLLGRDPESEATVVSHLEAGSVEALRRRIMRSAEFRQAAGFPMAELVAEAPAASDLDATPEELQALLVRQRRSWDALGGTAPHWSCLPEPSYRPESLPLHRRDFYASGREDRLLLEGVLARLGMLADRFGHLVEFGCGVGRATLHLAAICPEVTAVDISPSHLALARAEGKARGLDHIRWLRSRPDLPVPAERADIWFSRRVLQHNPPPLIRETLWQAFATLAPGGLAVFQLLTRGAGYGFSLAACLAGRPPQQPELHVLPQREVFALATAAGLQVLEVQDDAPAGLDRRRWVSHLFVMRRPG